MCMRASESTFSRALDGVCNLPSTVKRAVKRSHKFRRILGLGRRIRRTFLALTSLPQHLFRVKVNKERTEVPKIESSFDRRYVDRWNGLNCIPDIEAVKRFNARQICNVMAAWSCFKREYLKIDEGVKDYEGFRDGDEQNDFKKLVNRRDYVVYTNNERMRVFLEHLTKWQVLSPNSVDFNMPKEKFVYFGINPSRRELAALKDNGFIGGVIVGSDAAFVSKVLKIEIEDSFYDTGILSGNKFVSLI